MAWKLSGSAFALALFAFNGAAYAAPPASGSTYVALGSSYAAGTSLPKQAEDSLPRCGQGTESYPRQVARAFNLKLVDRSCGGATTVHLLRGGQFDMPAQIDALTADTSLVTITTGGNDIRFTADLARFTCLHRPEEVAEAARAATCDPPRDFNLEKGLTDLEANLHQLVAEIRRRAPAARIVFVDYVTVVPPKGTCAAFGLTAEEAAIMRDRGARLAALTAKVAKEDRADLIQASSLTRSYNVCAAKPWAWGFVPPAERAKSNAVAFHPRLDATNAVAKSIIQRLKK